MRRKAVRVAVVTLVWAPVFLFASHFASGGAEAFAGYTLGSSATGSQWTYDQPSLGVPAHPSGEFNVAFSQSNLSSGPAGYGLSSTGWPGQVAASVPSFVQGSIESGIRDGGGPDEFFPADVPNYPVRAESFYPQGPQDASSGAGGTRMHSEAHESLAGAETFVAGQSFPGLGDTGSQASKSFAGLDGNTVVSSAEARANDISIAGGLITIEQVVSRAIARSDGTRATLEGGTTASGVKFVGQDVALDGTGLHALGQGLLGGQTLNQQINTVLNNAGIQVSVAEAIDLKNGPEASRALGGVLVRFSPQAFETYVGQVPEPLRSQMFGQIPRDQTITLAIAPAVVQVNAAPAFEFTPPTPPPGGGVLTPPGGGTTEGGTTGGGATLGGGTSGGTGGGNLPTSGGTPGTLARSGGGEVPGGDGGGGSLPPTEGFTTAAAPIASSGVPVGLAVALGLAALASSKPLMMLADKLLTAAPSNACPHDSP